MIRAAFAEIYDVPAGGPPSLKHLGTIAEGVVIETPNGRLLFDRITGGRRGPAPSGVQASPASPPVSDFGPFTLNGNELRRSGSLVMRTSPETKLVVAGECAAFFYEKVFFVIRRDGAVTTVDNLPLWMRHEPPYLLSSDPVLEALVFTTSWSIAWLPFAELAKLPREGRFPLSPETLHGPTEVVAKVTSLRLPGQPGWVPENSISLEFGRYQTTVQSELAGTVRVGDLLPVRRVDRRPTLFNAAGTQISSGGNLDQLLRTDSETEARYDSRNLVLEKLVTRSERARELRTAEVDRVLAELTQLGVIEGLTGEVLDDATLLAFDGGMCLTDPRDVTAYVLEAWLRGKFPSHPHVKVEGRRATWLNVTYLAADPSDVAILANRALEGTADRRRWRGVMHPSSRPLYLLFSPEQEELFTQRKLLRLEKWLPEPLEARHLEDGSALEAHMPVGGGVLLKGTTLRLGLHAAAALLKTLRFLPPS